MRQDMQLFKPNLYIHSALLENRKDVQGFVSWVEPSGDVRVRQDAVLRLVMCPSELRASRFPTVWRYCVGVCGRMRHVPLADFLHPGSEFRDISVQFWIHLHLTVPTLGSKQLGWMHLEHKKMTVWQNRSLSVKLWGNCQHLIPEQKHLFFASNWFHILEQIKAELVWLVTYLEFDHGCTFLTVPALGSQLMDRKRSRHQESAASWTCCEAN